MIVVVKFVNFGLMKKFINVKTGKEVETKDPKIFEKINSKLGNIAWKEADKKGAKVSKPKSNEGEEPKKK